MQINGTRKRTDPASKVAAQKGIVPRRLFIIAATFLMFFLPLIRVPPIKAWQSFITLPTLAPGMVAGNSFVALLNPDCLIVLLMVMYVISVKRSRQDRLTSALSFNLAAALILLGGTLSLFSSAYPNVSGAILIGQVSMFAFAWAIHHCQPTELDIRRFLIAGAVGTGLIFTVGLFVFYRDIGLPGSMMGLINAHFSATFRDSYGRVMFGTIAQSNSLILLTLPICVCMVNCPDLKRWERIVYGVVAIILLLNLGVAFERWAIIITLLFFVFFLASIYRGKRKWLLISAVVSLLIVAAVFFSRSVMDENVAGYFAMAATGAGTEGSPLSFRLDVFAEGIQLITENPTGIGLGMENLRPELVVTAIHNFFLDAAFEGGILTSVGLLIWSIWIPRKLFQVLRMPQRGLGMDMARGMLAGCVCFLIKGLFNNNPLYTYGTGVWMAYWFSFPLLAMALVQFQAARNPELAGNRIAGVRTRLFSRQPANPAVSSFTAMK